MRSGRLLLAAGIGCMCAAAWSQNTAAQANSAQGNSAQSAPPASSSLANTTAQANSAQNNTTQNGGATDGAGQTHAAGQNAQIGESSPSEQPTSLGDLARLERARKLNQPKAGKVYDDDNFLRTSLHEKSPEAAGASSPGQDVPLTELRGKVVVLDFWASWCGPCRQALPKLKQLQSTYSGEDFVVISVSEDDDEGTWRAFVSQHGMTWQQQFDGNGKVARRYGVEALPTYVLLGRDGNVIDRYEGEAPGVSIVERIGPDLRKALEARL